MFWETKIHKKYKNLSKKVIFSLKNGNFYAIFYFLKYFLNIFFEIKNSCRKIFFHYFFLNLNIF